MAQTTTLTIRLPAETRNQLAKLADHRNREESAIGAAAIKSYVARELAVIDAIKAGRADARAGRVTSHEDAMRTIRSDIDAAHKR